MYPTSSSGVATFLKLFGIAIATIGALGTVIVASKVFGIDIGFGVSDDEEALLAATQWQPVLTGLAATALGLITFGIGAVLDQVDEGRQAHAPQPTAVSDNDEQSEPWA